jgi:hypothetical protein
MARGRNIPAKHRLPSLFLIAGLATFSVAQQAPNVNEPKLSPQNSGTTQLLISVSPAPLLFPFS